jgi:hypothetical protein
MLIVLYVVAADGDCVCVQLRHLPHLHLYVFACLPPNVHFLVFLDFYACNLWCADGNCQAQVSSVGTAADHLDLLPWEMQLVMEYCDQV